MILFKPDRTQKEFKNDPCCNIDCNECVDCETCNTCDYCTDCIGCNSCYYCKDCVYCLGCKDCGKLKSGLFCKKVTESTNCIFCVDYSQGFILEYSVFNKKVTFTRFKEIAETIINVFPITEIIAIQGYWQTILPAQWKRLVKIPEFDKDITEKITKIKLDSFV